MDFNGSLDDVNTLYAKVRPMDIRAPFMVASLRGLQPIKEGISTTVKKKKKGKEEKEKKEEEMEKEEEKGEEETEGKVEEKAEEWGLPVKSTAEWRENMFLVKMGAWHPRSSFALPPSLSLSLFSDLVLSHYLSY